MMLVMTLENIASHRQVLNDDPLTFSVNPLEIPSEAPESTRMRFNAANNIILLPAHAQTEARK